MAKPLTTLYFGKYRGQDVGSVPTSYLGWVFACFPKMRNKIRPVLRERGLSAAEIRSFSVGRRVLGPRPQSEEKRRAKPLKPKRVRRNEQQLKANDAARAMGHQIPYPRYQLPHHLSYFQKGGQ